MPDGKAPYVSVKVEQIIVQPGEVVTLMVVGRNHEMVQIEVRSVGIAGSTVGHPEVFCDQEILFTNFGEWQSMDQAVRERFGLGRLMPPKPMAKGGK
jgi:hypothetical protein